MGLEAHLSQLSEKHRKLEETIAEELTHPDWNEDRVKVLKIQKLRLKDEIDRLRSPPTH